MALLAFKDNGKIVFDCGNENHTISIFKNILLEHFKFQIFLGGSLITSGHVLTAAHCMYPDL